MSVFYGLVHLVSRNIILPSDKGTVGGHGK